MVLHLYHCGHAVSSHIWGWHTLKNLARETDTSFLNQKIVGSWNFQNTTDQSNCTTGFGKYHILASIFLCKKLVQVYYYTSFWRYHILERVSSPVLLSRTWDSRTRTRSQASRTRMGTWTSEDKDKDLSSKDENKDKELKIGPQGQGQQVKQHWSSP